MGYMGLGRGCGGGGEVVWGVGGEGGGVGVRGGGVGEVCCGEWGSGGGVGDGGGGGGVGGVCGGGGGGGGGGVAGGGGGGTDWGGGEGPLRGTIEGEKLSGRPCIAIIVQVQRVNKGCTKFLPCLPLTPQWHCKHLGDFGRIDLHPL